MTFFCQKIFKLPEGLSGEDAHDFSVVVFGEMIDGEFGLGVLFLREVEAVPFSDEGLGCVPLLKVFVLFLLRSEHCFLGLFLEVLFHDFALGEILAVFELAIRVYLLWGQALDEGLVHHGDDSV
jgi:hypothetical protein